MEEKVLHLYAQYGGKYSQIIMWIPHLSVIRTFPYTLVESEVRKNS